MKHRTLFPNTSATLRFSGLKLPVFSLTLSLLLAAFGLCAAKAQAQLYAEQTLHTLQGDPIDGSSAEGTLININGTLYGTTHDGGDNGQGTLFSVSTDGSGFSMLISFGNNNPAVLNLDGANPNAGLINDNGILYGTTESGGAYNQGTVFAFDPATDTVTTLHSFAGGTTDGADPHGSLLPVSGLLFGSHVNGRLYGTTGSGGSSNQGTIFYIDLVSHAFKLVYSFPTSGNNGPGPYSSLILVNGVLYGTDSSGGPLGVGTVFSFDPVIGSEQVLHTFTGGDGTKEGAEPYAGLVNVNGVLYGTTYVGGSYSNGTLYSLNTDGSGYQSLYSFTNQSGDGALPVAGLININGLLYGTTFYGGAYGAGTVFSFDPSTQTETQIYQFSALDGSGDNADGAQPYAGLLNINGTLYGTTIKGGSSGYGTTFSLTPVTVPVAKNDSGRGIANHIITVAAPGVLGNDNTGGDPNCTATIVTMPTHGTVDFNAGGGFTYTPNPGFVGTDSFTYHDTNLAGTSNTATCTIAIGPIAYDDQGRTYFNSPVTINAPGVLANDVTGGLATTAALVTSPGHGTISFNSDGSFKYTPTSGFLGTDSFTYKITNAGGTSAPATCTMTVQARTPVANNDAGRVTHNTTATFSAPGVLGNDNAGDTGTITTTLVTGPSHGTITFHTDGSFVYTPTIGFVGTDSFTYKDTNAVGTSNTATCILTVQ